jgi:hypothetical protein
MACVEWYNLCIKQGETLDISFYYWDDDQCTIPVNLTGATAEMQIRQDYSSPTAEWSGSTVGGELVITGGEGRVDVQIDSATTTAFTFTEGVYDLELTMPSGDVIRLIEGNVDILPEVTR